MTKRAFLHRTLSFFGVLVLKYIELKWLLQNHTFFWETASFDIVLQSVVKVGKKKTSFYWKSKTVWEWEVAPLVAGFLPLPHLVSGAPLHSSITKFSRDLASRVKDIIPHIFRQFSLISSPSQELRSCICYCEIKFRRHRFWNQLQLNIFWNILQNRMIYIHNLAKAMT